MKKFVVTIEETIAQNFVIEVNDDENETCAIDAVICKYKAGELTLDPGEVQFRQISMSEPYTREWIEF